MAQWSEEHAKHGETKVSLESMQKRADKYAKRAAKLRTTVKELTGEIDELQTDLVANDETQQWYIEKIASVDRELEEARARHETELAAATATAAPTPTTEPRGVLRRAFEGLFTRVRSTVAHA
jgi:septal ring factor EnvC (AmiA/AmiB activator)